MPDAMTVIHLYELGLWEKLRSRIRLVVPSIIARLEAYYYIDPNTGEHVNIDLIGQIAKGHVDEAAASLADMHDLLAQFNSVIQRDLHEGEVEALTLLYTDQVSDCCFCSADRAAVKALVRLGLKDKSISLEMALKCTGLSTPRIAHRHSEKWSGHGRRKRRGNGSRERALLRILYLNDSHNPVAPNKRTVTYRLL